MTVKNHKHATIFAALLLAAVAPVHAQVTDPKVTTWVTARNYARVYTTTANKTAGNSVTTWTGVTSPFYTDIQRVVYSSSYVYLYATGMPSYVTGNWLTPNGMQYTSWPKNRAAIHRLPRTVTIPATKQKNNGSGGVLVNGVFVWANGDAQSYDNVGTALTATTATIAMTGDGIWNRLAGVAEEFNFDPAKGHHPSNGAYHNHVNPIGLRYQLGDHVTHNSSTKAYTEGSGSPTAHSPLIGFANDGIPIYGPYGYATATDANSGVRRMISGFVKRNGLTTNLSTSLPNTNLAATGRTTLPVWAASVQGKSTTLTAAEYGPNATATYAAGPINTPCSVGLFAEDYDYLGDIGYTQGNQFDLNRQNVRWCVTPEYPSGTYAYFVCIDASGNTVFPDIINQEYFGTAAMGQGTVTSITEAVTEYVKGGQASALTLTATASGANVQLSWPSVEGATYTAAYSNDGSNFTNLSTTLTGTQGGTATYTTAIVAAYYKITLSALASYDTLGNGGVSGLNTFATTTYSLPNTAPTLTQIGDLAPGTEDTVYPITYAAVAAAADEADADNNTLSFRVEETFSGALTKNGVPVTAGTLLSPGDTFLWTPPGDGNGPQTAMTVTAYDGTLASANPVGVQSVLAAVNDAPTLTNFTTLTGGTEDESYSIHMSQLENAGNEADSDTPTIGFRIAAVLTGTLTKNGVAVTPSTTTVFEGESLVWTPPANSNGTIAAFTLTAYDGQLDSTTALTANIELAPVSDSPVWDGGAGTSNWSDAANWSDNTLPPANDSAAFNGAASYTVSLGEDRTLTALSFSGNAGYILFGHSLTLSATSGTIATASPTSGSLTHTLATPLSLIGSTSEIATASGTTLAASGGLSTSGFVTKSGTGTLILSGSGSAVNHLTVSGGTVALSTDASLSTTTGVEVSSYSALTLSGGADLTATTLNLGSENLGTGTLNLSGLGTTATFSGAINGTATSQINLGIASRLSAASINTVPITITSGTLVLTGNNTSSAPITISSHVFTIETTGDAVLSGAITGSGALFKKGTSSLTLGSSHTRVGETHINDGTLRLTAPALSTSHALLLETDSTMELDFTGTQTVDQLIFGGVSQLTGTYGSLTSTATYKLAQITGSGLLEVTTTNFSFNEWATHKNLTVSNNSEGDDPDHDGISNVLEFVLGGNPLSTSTTILPTASVSGNDFIYTFKRTDFSESDRILYVQFSTDLNDWSESHNVSSNSSVSGSATITVAENGNADDTITVTRPKGTATQLFARIFIEED